jgi:hypothetical protein
MKKANPLFVDSTKFNGDQILTRLQLHAPHLASEDIVALEIVRNPADAGDRITTDVVLRVPLVFDEDEKFWRGQIHLDHLETIHVSPVSMDHLGGEKRGPTIEARGMHVIELDWIESTIPIPGPTPQLELG